jgi:hypothetical protein
MDGVLGTVDQAEVVMLDLESIGRTRTGTVAREKHTPGLSSRPGHGGHRLPIPDTGSGRAQLTAVCPCAMIPSSAEPHRGRLAGADRDRRRWPPPW